jgi:Uma2 family endonuclease
MEQPPAPRRVTLAEFLAYEARSRSRHEFIGGRVFAMSGVTRPLVVDQR